MGGEHSYTPGNFFADGGRGRGAVEIKMEGVIGEKLLAASVWTGWAIQVSGYGECWYRLSIKRVCTLILTKMWSIDSWSTWRNEVSRSGCVTENSRLCNSQACCPDELTSIQPDLTDSITGQKNKQSFGSSSSTSACIESLCSAPMLATSSTTQETNTVFILLYLSYPNSLINITGCPEAEDVWRRGQTSGYTETGQRVPSKGHLIQFSLCLTCLLGFKYPLGLLRSYWKALH